MSLHKKKVNNFIHLLKTQPSLFSPQHREEIGKLIASQPDEVKAHSNAISQWLVNYPNINSFLSQLKSESSENRAPGNITPNQNIPNYDTDKKTLLNAIHQTSSDKKSDDKGSNSGGK